MSKEFNGHASYENWNVSLWIGNDEGLYNKAREFAQQFGATEKTAKRFIEELADAGITQTPDGVDYTWTRVVAALEEYEEE